ncbi:hypothetical protein OGAPHI_004723 [Ogataea philodendri]|uniref:Mitochondrial import inner membrane translocase subunit TIM44 n=2 Tax=Saccharomycotina TaxID=147537 RepID=A0A9P8T3B3_9ASCO|nr:uncharacterized protein OGAPHI_004723 [Ogataea philodendri]KAH3664009.1 hypothetical protein OGAPHI_004723 [Ogataea philodendri]
MLAIGFFFTVSSPSSTSGSVSVLPKWRSRGRLVISTKNQCRSFMIGITTKSLSNSVSLDLNHDRTLAAGFPGTLQIVLHEEIDDRVVDPVAVVQRVEVLVGDDHGLARRKPVLERRVEHDLVVAVDVFVLELCEGVEFFINLHLGRVSGLARARGVQDVARVEVGAEGGQLGRAFPVERAGRDRLDPGRALDGRHGLLFLHVSVIHLCCGKLVARDPFAKVSDQLFVAGLVAQTHKHPDPGDVDVPVAIRAVDAVLEVDHEMEAAFWVRAEINTLDLRVIDGKVHLVVCLQTVDGEPFALGVETDLVRDGVWGCGRGGKQPHAAEIELGALLALRTSTPFPGVHLYLSGNGDLAGRILYKTSVVRGPSVGIRAFSSGGARWAGQKSPMQVFVDTFRREWKKSNELSDQIKQLRSATDEMGESEAFKRAKDAYNAAQKSSGAIAKGVEKTAHVVGEVAHKAWESPVGKGVRTTVEKTAETVDHVIEPIRKTKTYQEVSQTLDEGASRYGLYETKEQRRLRRERELENKPKAIKRDEEAGTALVATNIKSESSIKDKIKIKPNSAIGRMLVMLREKWEEAENPLLVLIRTVMDKIGSFFAETEGARVIKAFRELDPNFNTEALTKQLREYIVPEVLEAYITGDEKTLRLWLSEAPANILAAQQKQFRDQGIFSDGRILDVRNVEIVSSRMLEPNQIPVFVISARVQEINLFRRAKTGEVVAGTEEDIMLSTYALVITRVPEDVDNPETEGWKILEFVRGGSRKFT